MVNLAHNVEILAVKSAVPEGSAPEIQLMSQKQSFFQVKSSAFMRPSCAEKDRKLSSTKPLCTKATHKDVL